MRTTLFSLMTLALAAPAAAAPRVVATVPALAALAREVAGPEADVKALTRASQDPHFVDARPSLALDLNRADLLLLVGLGLESGWLPTLLTGARNPRVQPGAPGYLECSRFARLMEASAAPVDRSAGDIHPGGNPHFLTDPRVVPQVVEAIAARLGELDPAGRDGYRRRAAAFLQRLAAARAGWEKRLAPVKGAPVVAYHRTWVYLADWIGLEEVGFLEPKPGIPPNPVHVAQLRLLARQRKVRAVVQEEYYPETTSKLLAQAIPAPLVRVPGGPDFSRGQSYLDYMERLVSLLAQALAPRGGG